MFYQGVGQLFPWNAFITAAAYFSGRFCTTSFGDDFENYLSISFTASQTLGLAITILYGTSMTYHDKIVYPLYIYSAFFALTTLLVLMEVNADLLFWFTMLSCVGCGTAGAFLNAGFFSLSGMFPQEYTGAMMSGQGLAGLTVGLTSVITQAAGPAAEGFCDVAGTGTDDPATPEADAAPECADYNTNWSAFSYFTISTVVLGSCVVLFYVLMKLPFTKFLLRGQEHLVMGNRDNSSDSSYLISEPLLADGSSSGNGGLAAADAEANHDDVAESDMSGLSGVSGAVTTANTSARNSNSETTNSFGLSGIMKRNNATGSDGNDLDTTENPVAVGLKDSQIMNDNGAKLDKPDSSAGSAITLSGIKAIFNVVKNPAVTVWGCFAVTLALFPSLTVFLQSSNHCKEGSGRLSNDLFVPIFFVLFNLGDFTGRIAAGKREWQYLNADNVHIAGLARLIYAPLFMMCNVGANSQLPLLFESDVFPLVLMFTFAVSNGYVASSCMMAGPQMVDASEAPMAGNIMIFCLTAGLMTGSILSFFITYISQGVW